MTKSMKKTSRALGKREAVVRTSRTAELASLSITTTDQLAAYAVALEDLPGYSTIANAFDEYRILKLTFSFHPAMSDNYWETTSGSAVGLPVLMTAIDYDDAVTPANKDAVLRYDTCVVHHHESQLVRSFKPKVSVTYWQNAVSSGFGSASDRWLDCSSSGIEHYGIKCCLSPDPSAKNHGMKVRVFCKAELEFRRTV